MRRGHLQEQRRKHGGQLLCAELSRFLQQNDGRMECLVGTRLYLRSISEEHGTGVRKFRQSFGLGDRTQSKWLPTHASAEPASDLPRVFQRCQHTFPRRFAANALPGIVGKHGSQSSAVVACCDVSVATNRLILIFIPRQTIDAILATNILGCARQICIRHVHQGWFKCRLSQYHDAHSSHQLNAMTLHSGPGAFDDEPRA
mmetsp:Transcript_71577/g.232705  ORF Transcript_71577/g.232705 Transcript_71577/m.232705 type:complete len:201 (+) Transcript_71577:2024-2626(+)